MSKKNEEPEQQEGNEPLKCGIVMPISAIDGYSAEHWADVKSIIVDAVESIDVLNFSARLVSEADDIGVIQKRIVHGVYGSDVVVCDVSGKNPNVMFELGMRLAFDKPTIIIKDDRTDYMFDTGVIEHITYPRDLRFQQIINFKKLLAEKVVATYTAAKNDPEHSTFLKSFGPIKISQISVKEASVEQFMLEAMAEIQKDLKSLQRSSANKPAVAWVDHQRPRIYLNSDSIDQFLDECELMISGKNDAAFQDILSVLSEMKELQKNSLINDQQRKKIEYLLKEPIPLNLITGKKRNDLTKI